MHRRRAGGGAGGGAPLSVLRGERALLALGFATCALKAARDAGAPALLFHLALVTTAVVAMVMAGRAAHHRPAWLDGPRLVLVLLGLWLLPSVYARIGGDGFEYYALLRSPLLDGDLDFRNDFAGLGARPRCSSTWPW